MSFYNTTFLEGEQLKKAVADTKSQEDAIFKIYFNTRQAYGASQITKMMEKAGHKYPLWSNRRAITDLMQKRKDIVKTKQMNLNKDTGKHEHKYQLDFNKYPTVTGTEQTLFSDNNQRA